MFKKYYPLQQRLSIPPLMAAGRFLSAFGQPVRAMRLMGRHVNSCWWKSRSFAGYVPTENDVFVATFGKSGTNWMMQIAQQIACFGAAEFEHIHDLVPWPDAPFPEKRARLDDPSLTRRSPSGLRIIKTHFEQDYVPFNEQAKYIIVIRDPKEMLVSGYHFAGAALDALGVEYNLEQWLTEAMRPADFLFGDWATHTASWWALRNEPNVLVLSFADVKKDTPGVIDQVAELLGVRLSAEQRDKVIEKSSFAWMKAHESQFKALALPHRGKKKLPEMIRSGKSGKFKELLTPEQQAAVDQFFSTRLKQLNADFPYADLFQQE